MTGSSVIVSGIIGTPTHLVNRTYCLVRVINIPEIGAAQSSSIGNFSMVLHHPQLQRCGQEDEERQCHNGTQQQVSLHRLYSRCKFTRTDVYPSSSSVSIIDMPAITKQPMSNSHQIMGLRADDTRGKSP